MPVIDLSVMRLATYELMARPDVPLAVVIDEAVELAKRFSTDHSGRFVNGVLAAIAADVRHIVDGMTLQSTGRPLASRPCRPAEWHVSSSPLAAALFLVRVLGEPWGGGFDPFFPDTASYLRVSDRGPFRPRFWFDERPPAYPLVLWLLGGGGRAVVLVQSVAYVMAWIWLGAVVWQRIASRPVAVVTIACAGVDGRAGAMGAVDDADPHRIALDHVGGRRGRRVVAIRGRTASGGESSSPP